MSLASGSSHRARLPCRSSRSASWPRLASVAKAVKAVAVDFGEPQLRALGAGAPNGR